MDQVRMSSKQVLLLSVDYNRYQHSKAQHEAYRFKRTHSYHLPREDELILRIGLAI
ncbi:hypothetical protein P9989_08715 [Halobacillus naozhouensis]|uniref:Transposase n=1 Tax=Halobacillus naozhouensis TaxID=554880 RepID=A0ABY8J1Q2_9BACI|nr:hypothetical protein [Halobacillus naozhouensis]WFT76428.1 hypothetical protein P9989_08715 [Halobacillus naozhouensis]